METVVASRPSQNQCRRRSLRKGMFSRNMLHQNPPTSTTTTDDDNETPSFYHPSVSSSDSVLSLHRRRSNRTGQHVALMVVQTPVELTVDNEWDYSETERWGWVILATTWAVFVVGMGSCLGVWTWAWDVGETPYAPPELEDDPTLPITGYYPALMVCTAIMAWIWVVVAWVGMKFFRHSKVVGDES